MDDPTFNYNNYSTYYTPSLHTNDSMLSAQWAYSSQTSYSSQSASPAPSVSPSKRPYPFDGDGEGFSSTPPSLRPQTEPTAEVHLSEPIDEDTGLLCYGTITDVKAQVTVGSRQPTFQTYGEVHSFDVVEEGAYFSLKHDGINFARLNKGICPTLKALTTNGNLELRAFVLQTEVASIKSAWYHNSRKIFSLEINIYGEERDIDEAGRTLSDQDLFLQYPTHGLDGSTYRNPHILEIEGFPSGVPDPAADDADEAKERSEQNGTQDKERDTPEDGTAAVDNILDQDLTHHVELGEITVDRRIRQTLRPHQKEAIDFVSQREGGKMSSELSLWKYNDVDQDEPFYQHVFTGAKRPERLEAKGGIIADEMGLGKTLVILSTIAGTIDRAQEFVKDNQPAEGQKVRKIPSQATLVVCPSSLLVDSWVKEIREHSFPGAISFHRHLGAARHAERHLLQEKMIVFTTYATVAIEYGREKHESPLAKINWFRIVLDEAHDIRNPATNQFRAAAALTAQHRWCLTGTPIQNGLDDLGALTTFLKVPILEAPQTFAKIVKNPINTNAPTRFQNLRVLLKTICLRRTRELLDLPEPVPQIRRIPLTEAERADYNQLLEEGQVQINMAVSGRRKGRINSTVLEALLKLRLFCNNGKDFGNLHSGPNGLPEDPDEALAYLQQLELNICAFCGGMIYSLSDSADTEGGSIIGKCAHLVCQNCLPQHKAQKTECPTCAKDGKNEISTLKKRISGLHMASTQNNAQRKYPSKLLALLKDLRGDLGSKSIVFSCWKKTLNIVAALLNYYNIPYNMIDGSLALNERLKALENFRSPTGANILLMTLGTGAVGLNLAVATRIYLLEPQWNPSIEMQAIGRALRLGQTEQVKIIRYVMAHTVEESNVLDRQKRKRELAGGGFGGGGKGKDVASLALDIFHVDVTSHAAER